MFNNQDINASTEFTPSQTPVINNVETFNEVNDAVPDVDWTEYFVPGFSRLTALSIATSSIPVLTRKSVKERGIIATGVETAKVFLSTTSTLSQALSIRPSFSLLWRQDSDPVFNIV